MLLCGRPLLGRAQLSPSYAPPISSDWSGICFGGQLGPLATNRSTILPLKRSDRAQQASRARTHSAAEAVKLDHRRRGGELPLEGLALPPTGMTVSLGWTRENLLAAFRAGWATGGLDVPTTATALACSPPLGTGEWLDFDSEGHLLPIHVHPGWICRALTFRLTLKCDGGWQQGRGRCGQIARRPPDPAECSKVATMADLMCRAPLPSGAPDCCRFARPSRPSVLLSKPGWSGASAAGRFARRF